MTRTARAALLAITLLAFVLRVHHLDGQSLWYDEGFSVYLAQMGLAEITARTAADIQPPVYYYLLHAWLPLGGQSEFSLRFPSALFGVLTVPLLYALARRLLGERAALLAALALAVSPFHIWYAQEARMYTLATLLGLLSSLILLRRLLVDDGSRAVRAVSWLAYVAANVIAVYTHYYAFFVVAAQGAFVLLWRLQRGRDTARPVHRAPAAPARLAGGHDARPPHLRAGRDAETPARGAADVWPPDRAGGHDARPTQRAVTWALTAQAVTLASFLPWAGFAINRYAVDESYWAGTLALDFVRKTVLAFVAGHAVFENEAQSIAIGYLVLLALGALAMLVQWRVAGRSPLPLVFLALYLVIPFLLLYAFSAWRPKFNPRYLMLASPPFFALLGAGLAALWGGGSTGRVSSLATESPRVPNSPRVRNSGTADGMTSPQMWLGRLLALGGLIFVLVTAANVLDDYYHNRVLARDDFRSVAARLAAERLPDEAIILSAGHLFPVFDYYYPNQQSGDGVYRIPAQETLSTRAVLTYDVAADLNDIARRYAGVWLVLWQDDVVDPNRVLTGLLDSQSQRLPLESRFWGIELRRYRFAPGVVFTPPLIEKGARVNFANRLELLGYAPATLQAPSGQSADLTLFWQARQPLAEDYWLAARLVDERGHIYARLDQRPASYTYPTMRWQPGVVVAGPIHLPVLAGAPPGDYTLQVMVYDPARGRNLDVLDERGAPSGASAAVGTIRVGQPVVQPDQSALALARALSMAMGGGMEIIATSAADRPARQGETATIDIVWRNQASLRADYRLRWRLMTPQGAVTQEGHMALTGVSYETSLWPPGSIVRGRYDITIPAAAPERLQLLLALDDGQAVIGDWRQLAEFSVARVERLLTPPAMQQRQTAVFGDVATLLGYDLAPTVVQAGQAIDLTLYWRAGGGAATTRPHAVFTHLLGAEERIYGQHDSEPANGERPTASWQADEIVIDRHRLVVKPETPAGDYVLQIGLYDPLSDRRLEATLDGGTRRDQVDLSVQVRVER